MELFRTFTSRYDGFSKAPFESLNLGFHVGDEPKDVQKNRVFLQKNYNLNECVFMEQIHSDKVELVFDGTKTPRCDAIITNKPNLALCVMVADCIPLLLFDGRTKSIGAVHAGRAGVFSQIATKTVQKMSEVFGSCPSDIKAFLGSSIKQCCYEISGEVLNEAREKYPDFVQENRLDLQDILCNELESLGVFVKREDRCTCCENDLFSYRRSGRTGRNVGIIMLRRQNA